MFEVQILVPVVSNEGSTFPAEHHAAFEAVLLAAFNGFTRLPAAAVGAWKNADGARFDDATVVYVVALASIGAGGAVVEVARFALAHYRQEAVYVRYLGVSEVIAA